jgi:hypothetical protein
VDAGHRIRLEFTDLDIEGPYPTCDYDVLSIYEAEPSGKRRGVAVSIIIKTNILVTMPFQKLCGSAADEDLPLSFTSTGNIMTLYFTSDEYGSGKGFSATWTDIGEAGIEPGKLSSCQHLFIT